ncbi:hypothetical protein CAHE111092_04830 [Campylobacter hepaticus]
MQEKIIGVIILRKKINLSITKKKELQINFNAIKNKINNLKSLDKNSLFQGAI